MSGGGYRGGSTIIRTRPKLSGRKRPKKGAIEAWIEDAAKSGLEAPEDLRLAPIQRFQPQKKKCIGKKVTSKKKMGSSKKNTKTKPAAIGQPNEPLPEYAELVLALREKYSK